MSTMTTAPKRPPTHDEAVTIAVAGGIATSSGVRDRGSGGLQR